MTKKKRTLEQILHENWIEPWVERLNLGYMHLHVTLVDEVEDNHKGAAAICHTNPPYNSAEIEVLESWFVDSLEDGEDQEIEFVLVHELCHLVLLPVVGLAPDIIPRKLWNEHQEKVEGLCDTLAINFISLHHGEKRGIIPWS